MNYATFIGAVYADTVVGTYGSCGLTGADWAADDEEVGTIVWISCGESPIGVYEDVGSDQQRGRAYQGFCEVAVIDRAAALIVARRTFDAPFPPSTSTSRGDVHTVVDVEDVVRFLAGLPEEPSHAPVTATAPALEPGSSLTITLSGPDWTDLETEVIIGPLVSGRRYEVSTTAGGPGTFTLDDRDGSATLTFAGETASGVRMAWTAECVALTGE